MKDDIPKESYTGTRYKVVHCEGALKSYEAAVNRVERRKHKKFTRAIIMQIERLANGERMTKENFPQEGNLPKSKGKNKSKKFHALKRIPIRGYCWLSDKHKDTYFISHYVYKDYANLKDSDTKKVKANWLKVEEGK